MKVIQYLPEPGLFHKDEDYVPSELDIVVTNFNIKYQLANNNNTITVGILLVYEIEQNSIKKFTSEIRNAFEFESCYNSKYLLMFLCEQSIKGSRDVFEAYRDDLNLGWLAFRHSPQDDMNQFAIEVHEQVRQDLQTSS